MASSEASEGSATTVGPAQAGSGTAAVDLLGSFLALVPDAAIVVDADGRIVAANEQALAMFGYGADDLLGRPIEALVPERFRHGHRQHRGAYSESPQARPMGAGLDLCGRRHDGTEFPVDISLAPLSTASGGRVVAAIRDATERRALTAGMAQLAAVVRSSPDAIFSTTLEGKVTSWNPGAERLFGYPSDEVVGQLLSALVPEDASAAWEELLSTAMAGAVPNPLDTQWLRRGGQRADVAVTVAALHEAGGRVSGFSAIVRDITARKAAERELLRVSEDLRRGERQQAAAAEVRLALLSE
ncbi:MAG TPA: PAS domain S-box protein, partial [Acidimicrobiales bacterium]|nr:PAS domain S-box protein [Acidimicrobiales bacterium]